MLDINDKFQQRNFKEIGSEEGSESQVLYSGVEGAPLDLQEYHQDDMGGNELMDLNENNNEVNSSYGERFSNVSNRNSVLDGMMQFQNNKDVDASLFKKNFGQAKIDVNAQNYQFHEKRFEFINEFKTNEQESRWCFKKHNVMNVRNKMKKEEKKAKNDHERKNKLNLAKIKESTQSILEQFHVGWTKATDKSATIGIDKNQDKFRD